MKKSFAFTSIFIVFLFVTVMVVPVFAAGSLTLDSVTYVKDILNNTVTFTVTYTATSVDYVSILATKGDSRSSAPTATSDNIVYVKQASPGSGTFTFTFLVPYNKFSEETPYCWIKIGGTPITNTPAAEVRKIFDPLQDKIDTLNSEIRVDSRIGCNNDDYELYTGQKLTIDNFFLKNATVDTGETGSIIMNGTTITGVVKFDSYGRIYTSTSNVLKLMKPGSVMKPGSIGFIIAKEISSQSRQEFTVTANSTNNKIVSFDVAGLSGTTIFGITICNIPDGNTVTLTSY